MKKLFFVRFETLDLFCLTNTKSNENWIEWNLIIEINGKAQLVLCEICAYTNIVFWKHSRGIRKKNYQLRWARHHEFSSRNDSAILINRIGLCGVIDINNEGMSSQSNPIINIKFKICFNFVLKTLPNFDYSHRHCNDKFLKDFYQIIGEANNSHELFKRKRRTLSYRLIFGETKRGKLFNFTKSIYSSKTLWILGDCNNRSFTRDIVLLTTSKVSSVNENKTSRFRRLHWFPF